MKRQRLREYTRHGRSDKYLKLKNIFDEKSKDGLKKYKETINIEVTEGRRGSTYPALKRLGSRPCEATQTGFVLPAHAELNLSSNQSAEILADYFSQIDQEYSPLDLCSLPPNAQEYI